MGKDKAFQPHLSTPVLNADGTLNEQFVTYLNQLQAQSNSGGDEIEEALGAIYAFLAPSLSGLGAQIFEQGKEVQDLVQSIAANQTQGNLTAAILFECKKVISDQEQLIAQLLSAVGGLSAQLSELTKPRPIRFESAAYQMLDNDSGVVADASGGDFDVALPDPAKNTDKDYFLQTLGGGGTATLKPFASEEISEDTELDVPSVGPPASCAVVKSDGTDWIIK